MTVFIVFMGFTGRFTPINSLHTIASIAQHSTCGILTITGYRCLR